MRPIFRHLFTAGLFLLALHVYGQPLITTFSPATVNASLGGTVSLQLKVKNFTNITSLQLPITYNNAVLTFTSINNSTLPGFSAANYNATTGKVTVSWYPDLAAYPNGFTIADNSSIFTMNFTVAANGSTTVNIANVSPLIEVTRSNNVIQVDYNTGGSNVTGGTGGPGPLMGFHVLSNTINIPQGQTGCMPVTVHDFTNIVSAAYAMHWNTSVLQYQNTQSYNLPDLSGANFNPYGSGTLLMSWYDQTLNGVTRADGSSIYQVCFKATGAPGTTSMVTIDGVGFPPGGGGAEVINASSQDVWKSDSGVGDTLFIVTAPPPPNAVTFTADKDTVFTGQVTCVDVRVTNFTDILSMQLGLTYDATKLQFQSLQFGANPLSLSNANFNPNVPGEIKFTWYDPAALGFDLADSTMIFSVCFTATGAPGTLSPVNFTALPGFAIEIIKEPDGEVTPNLVNGHVYISDLPPLAVQIDSVKNVLCNGASTGAIFITATGGSSPQYSWSGMPGNPDPEDLTGIPAGTYTVTVTFAGGGTVTTSTVVAQPNPLAMPQVTPTGVTCYGGTNGSIAITMTGGTPPYSFTWAGTGNPPANPTTGASGTTVNNLLAGTYTTTVTDAMGCTKVSSPIAVSSPTEIKFLSAPTVSPVNCFGNTNGAINVAITGGSPQYTYAWTGPNGFTAATEDLNGLSGGQYTLKVTDSKGCSKTLAPVQVNAPSAALQVNQTGAITDATCFGANNGKACITIAGGTLPYTSTWRLNSANGPTIATGLCPNSLAPGTYYVNVTDNNGCTSTTTIGPVGGPLTQLDIGAPAITNVKCAGANDGCITITPTGGNDAPFTLKWSNNMTTANICSLAGGDYFVTVTDKIGCTSDFGPIAITEPSAITLDSTHATPQTGVTANGTVTVHGLTGGTPIPGTNYTFAWSGPNGFTASTMDISDLVSGTYTLTITDGNGCTKTATAFVDNTNLLIGTEFSATPSCNNDGCINLAIPPAAAAPFLVTWNGGAQSKISTDHVFSICSLKSGTYALTITDAANNELVIQPVSVPQNDPAIVGDSRTNPFKDSKNGSIVLTPIPQGTDLKFEWSTGDTTNTLMNLDSGTYCVTVTHPVSMCQNVYCYTLKRTYLPLQVLVSQVTPSKCVNSFDGAITLTVNNGNDPYTYNWTGPNNFTNSTANPSGLSPGTYTCTITDQNDTVKVQVVVVPTQSNLAISNVNELSNYGGYQVSSTAVCDGKATVVFGGSSGNTSIIWSNGITTATNDKLCGGAYTVTVTDQLGCTSVWSDSLTVPESVVAVFDVTSDYNGYDVPCNGECVAVANVYVVGGIPPYTVKWPSGQKDQITQVNGFSQAKQLCAGDYTVTITDAFSGTNGATYTYTGTVIEPEALTIEFSDVPPFSFASCDGQVVASTPGGVGEISYTWSSAYGQSGDTLFAENLCAGDVLTFIVEDDFGCIGQANYKVPYPVDGCLQVRPVITPGQSDKNDYTLITCIEDYPENTFEVYNRWGQLVYQTTGYNNADSGHRWEGLTARNEILPDGVYFYVLKFVDDNGRDQILKGYINLLR